MQSQHLDAVNVGELKLAIRAIAPKARALGSEAELDATLDNICEHVEALFRALYAADQLANATEHAAANYAIDRALAAYDTARMRAMRPL